ncbi:hypothetical protein Patl1_35907 [Pistacia atlantica]|nr:hypothetical protein Patl1_35907 [Pistacia atlantica]
MSSKNKRICRRIGSGSWQGYKFHPTDVDIIAYYLYNKVFGLPLSNDIFKDCNLYGCQEPSDISEFYRGEKGEYLYTFTPLKKKSRRAEEFEGKSVRVLGRVKMLPKKFMIIE